MKKATDAMLNDHKMIRKLLDGLRIDNPRAPQAFLTLGRVVRSHAWLEDNAFLPAFKKSPLLTKVYLDNPYEEHKLIDTLHDLIADAADARQRDAYMQQFRAVLENHLQKEEDALFPLAESILDSEGLNKLGLELEKQAVVAQQKFNPGAKGA